jgi:hypothetical protein
MSKAKKGSGKSPKGDGAKAPKKSKAPKKAKKNSEKPAEKKPSRLELLLEQFREVKGVGDGPSYEDIDSKVQKVVGLIAQTSIGIRGGRHNERTVEGVDVTDDGRQITRYRGESVIDNLQDIKDADAMKQWCYRNVQKLGVQTRLGTIIPGTARNELARALAACMVNCRKFNLQEVPAPDGTKRHRTCEIVYNWALYESTGDSRAATAALLDQIGSVFERVERAQHDAEEAVLARAPNSSLPKGMTSAEIMKLPKQQRRPIVAKARAELARKALADIAGAELILPEEVSVDLAKTVDLVKCATKAWVASASEGDEAYEKALAETDLSGLSQQQEYLVAAASKKRDEATNAAIVEAGLEDEAQLDMAPLFAKVSNGDLPGDGAAD